MGFGETLIFYLVVGGVVAVAVYAADDRRSRIGTAFHLAMAIVFWPLYLPLLLSAPPGGRPVDASAGPQSDAMAAAIADVERELDTALANLDGWAESALPVKKGGSPNCVLPCRPKPAGSARWTVAGRRRVRCRRSGRRGPRCRCRSLPATAARPPAAADRAALGRCRRSEQARAQNLARLAAVRQQTHADLMATLAWIRELVSMMHLAKFTGAPASRTEELMAQIAAAVEGVSDAGWRGADEDRWASIAAAADFGRSQSMSPRHGH